MSIPRENSTTVLRLFKVNFLTCLNRDDKEPLYVNIKNVAYDPAHGYTRKRL